MAINHTWLISIDLGGSRRISAELGDVLEAQLQHRLDLVELLGRELRERSK